MAKKAKKKAEKKHEPEEPTIKYKEVYDAENHKTRLVVDEEGKNE